MTQPHVVFSFALSFLASLGAADEIDSDIVGLKLLSSWPILYSRGSGFRLWKGLNFAGSGSRPFFLC